MVTRIDVVFDLAEDHPYYLPSVGAIEQAAVASGIDAEVRVVRTKQISADYFENLPDGVLIGPGTPYDVPAAAEEVIFTARERGIPLVGT